MKRSVKTRAYDSQSRKSGALKTRRAILVAARDVFLEAGYAAATMAAVAEGAGVALDTIYATVGRKAELFRLLVETAISGKDEPVSALERDYVHAIQATQTAAGKLRVYARAVRAIQGRLAPFFLILREAEGSDVGLTALWREISERRARNMRLFATELQATGEMRAGLDANAIADIIWSMNSSEYYDLLVRQRNWSAQRFERWLVEAWCRTLLRGSPCDASERA
jgi:AcrR family transcriptional regulator